MKLVLEFNSSVGLDGKTAAIRHFKLRPIAEMEGKLQGMLR